MVTLRVPSVAHMFGNPVMDPLSRELSASYGDDLIIMIKPSLMMVKVRPGHSRSTLILAGGRGE